MRTMLNEYGMFMIGAIVFASLMFMLSWFISNFRSVSQIVIANVTGSPSTTLTSWNHWDE